MLHDAPVTSNHRLQYRAPTIGAMDVAPPQRAPLDIAELVEHEQWMITGAGKVAIVGTAFLLSVSRALARIHVEHDGLRRSPPAHLVDPLTGQIGESNKVLGPTQPLRFETPHLAGRGGISGDRLLAHHPAHRRVATQPRGIVHVFVPGQPPEHRLAQQTRQPMPTVLAGACIRRVSAPVSVKLSASSSSRYASSPASEVIVEPRNCSINRRSKSSRTALLSASPIGFAIADPLSSP